MRYSSSIVIPEETSFSAYAVLAGTRSDSIDKAEMIIPIATITEKILFFIAFSSDKRFVTFFLVT